ncbi:hypothetical protein M6B38_179830 [Iris pallida]|uniref:Uncharacterized protein n=1 Tax=Iris pallida TaxID=29817 RepID=A0AAX6END9_IRIPA|nr:hypothetical protein M6B38_179830 [Iris pallida]
MSPGASARGRRIRGPLVQGDWLETKATSDTILSRMIWNVLAKSQFSIFLIDVRFAFRLLGILEENNVFASLIYSNVKNQTMSQKKCSCLCRTVKELTCKKGFLLCPPSV